jgi:hypothetical protein
MEAWAKYVLETRSENVCSHHNPLNIRAAAAYAALRRQSCFALATDYEIRRAVAQNSAIVNYSFIRADMTKGMSGWGVWPPLSRFDFDGLYPKLGLAPPAESPEEYRSQWSGPMGTWVTLAPTMDGLPDREEYFRAVWDAMIEEFARGQLPLPPYPWAKFRPRLLSPDRFAKAAASLPYRCPICFSDRRHKENHQFFWEWFGEDEGPIFCFGCTAVVHDLRERARRAREAAGRAAVPKKISAAAAQQALRELGVHAPKREAVQVIQQILTAP